MTRLAALLPLLLALAGPAAAQQQAGETCLGVGGLQCAEGLMCVVPDGEADVADASGTCTPPEASMCTMEYDPVCGSDGQTYGNACQAQAAGADVSSTGACGG